MTATFHVGDAITVMNTLPEKSVDLILSSPPFLALRSYLPADHPLKSLEGGSQATPGAYIDWLVDVVEACARILAPHGSLCFELGDTYAGSGGGGGDYLEGGWREGQTQFAGSAASMKESNAAHWRQKNINASAWPLAKSLSLIPELFRYTLVYGTNPLTGRQTERWRLRNVIRWVRPNPPVGALGDKFRPATSELMVFCKSAKRFFDLDAVREPHQSGDHHIRYPRTDYDQMKGRIGETREKQSSGINPAGAPPLDWWEITRGPCGEPGCKDGIWNIPNSIYYGKPCGFCARRSNPDTDNVPLDWWNIPPGGYAGAHYAVWPPELLIKPIKAMCPEKVCRTCGEPSRRIVSSANATDERQALADYLRTRREAVGVTVKELAAYFPSVSGGMTGCVWNWENAANVPTAEQWPILKDLLTLDGRFDVLVTGERTWTESEIEYRDVSDAPSGWTQDGNGRVYQRLATRKDRIAPDRFSDCGHNNYRNGIVLDPFAGSGTTLAVATGHGRDAIGIDLDARNFDLALERVGPLLLQRGEVAA